jgi:negative regulator of sigma E activity
MMQTFDQLMGRVPYMVWVAIVAAAASAGGTYAIISSQVAMNSTDITNIRETVIPQATSGLRSEIQRVASDQAVTNARIDARIRATEDDNRDQKAAIDRIDTMQKDFQATLRVFQDDTRSRLEYLLITATSTKTTLENIAAASGVRLPGDEPPPSTRRPGR